MLRRTARLVQLAYLLPLLTCGTAFGQNGQPPAGHQLPPQRYPQTPAQGPVQQGPVQQGPQAAPVQGPPRPPQAPFQLTPQQQAELTAVLEAWEDRSRKITTLSCTFTRWDYDPVFGMKDKKTNEVIPKQSKGILKYAAPDKGLYRIEEITECIGEEGDQKKFVTRKEGGEHWVCDGVSVWEYNYQKEQLIERRLPPELRGKAIADGPLPFLFGADAQKLQHRYFLRLQAPPANVRGQIWLEAYPKYAMDATNFRRATLILDQKTMLPFAIELNLHDGGGTARQVHQFSNNLINNLFRIFQGDFSKPALPRGWTKVEEAPRSPPLSSNPPPKRG